MKVLILISLVSDDALISKIEYTSPQEERHVCYEIEDSPEARQLLFDQAGAASLLNEIKQKAVAHFCFTAHAKDAHHT